MIQNLTFGTDAEFFLRTVTGQPFPVTGLIGGTKEKPLPIKGLPKGFAVQEDNTALEFNIPPSGNILTILDYVSKTFKVLAQRLPKAVEFDLENASVEVPKEYVERIKELGVFGCDPDYNAWQMQMNDKPVPASPGFRSAAAHVHLGWENPNDDDRLEIIRLADVFVTLPALAKENESEIKRRALYGKAGAFRFKDYGVEHRVASNQWLVGEARIKMTLHQYLKAVAALNVGMVVPEGDYERIEGIINNHDVAGAESYMKEIAPKYEANDDWDKETSRLEDEAGIGFNSVPAAPEVTLEVEVAQ